ncbi:MAG: hypothetical protein GY801_24560 [bacterium]|nr:hypothetical protein [bacterium]
MALKLQTSASFRAVAKRSAIVRRSLKVPLQTAAPNTILLWIQKLGYYLLTRPKERADDWMIFLDHSIQLGPEKLFVVLGIRESQFDVQRPLCLQDLTPLCEVVKGHWTGESVGQILRDLTQELGAIRYAVGDYGSDIKKGLRLADIPHVHDVTHHIALILKALYASDAEYLDITQRLARVRKQFGQTGAAHLIPPKQRKKSRYHNLKPLAEYGRHVQRYLSRAPAVNEAEQRVCHVLTWVPSYRAFFDELLEISTLVGTIEWHLKHHGLSPTSIAACCQALDAATTAKGGQLKTRMLQYFQLTGTLLEGTECLLCTSDILESAFGKYKNYVSENSLAGITGLALCIAAFTSSLAAQELKDALEHTTTRDVHTWITDHVGPTLFKKRHEAFSEQPKME